MQEESLQTVVSPSSSKQEINGFGMSSDEGTLRTLVGGRGVTGMTQGGSREDHCERHDNKAKGRAGGHLWLGCSSFSTAAATPWCTPHWRDSQQKQLCSSEGGSDPVSR